MELLLPAVQRAARTSPESRSRIVWTASSAAYLGQMNTAAFKPGPARDGRATFDIYNDSKLLDIICAREASRRYAGAGVVVTSVNPGNTATDLWRHGTAFEMWFFVRATISE
jgi:retinol dehydrogenase-12